MKNKFADIQNTKNNIDSSGIDWRDIKFAFPKREIRLGTSFSGIGAIEQALNLMKIEHENIFACDNGELELKLLPSKEQAEYDKLKKIARYRITPEESHRLARLTSAEHEIIDSYAKKIAQLPTIAEKRRYVDDLYKKHSQGINFGGNSYYFVFMCRINPYKVRSFF